MTLTVGDTLTNIELQRAAAGGKAIAVIDGHIIMVDAGIIGDIATIEITAVKANYSEAKIHHLEHPSEARQAPVCEHYEQCGGCQLQHSHYDYQVATKQQVLNHTLEKIGSKAIPKVDKLLAAPEPYYYRNKLSFSFSNNCWQPQAQTKRALQQAGIGFHLAKAPEQVLDIRHCWLQSALSNAIINDIRDYLGNHSLTCYDFKKNRGLLRDLVVRENREGQMMLIFQVSYHCAELEQLFDHLSAKFNAIRSIYYVINTQRDNNFSGLTLNHYWGDSYLPDTLGDLRYEISPKAFYQTNADQTERLYSLVSNLAKLSKHDTVYDLYCGTGTIGLWLAAAAKKVIGIEVVSDAVDDATRNAALNGIDNASFHTGKAETLITQQFIKANGKPDVIVVDPPRAGLDAKLIEQLNTLKPSRLIYVSCEPATFARDLQRLSAFSVEQVDAVDMFPQTYHIEAVALLKPLKKAQTVKPKKRSLKY